MGGELEEGGFTVRGVEEEEEEEVVVVMNHKRRSPYLLPCPHSAGGSAGPSAPSGGALGSMKSGCCSSLRYLVGVRMWVAPKVSEIVDCVELSHSLSLSLSLSDVTNGTKQMSLDQEVCQN